jgi:ParB family chromosome partitioning protein
MSEELKTKSENKKALGRGLASLLGPGANISANVTKQEASPDSPKQPNDYPDQQVRANLPFQVVEIKKVQPNPDQPRKVFNQAKLEELAASIREHGIVQPILVRKGVQVPFEIVAGERRWRAAQLAGLTKVPVVLRDDEIEVEKDDLVSLIENVQREDLSPLELAAAYSRLLVSQSYSQESLADKLGVSRVSVANTVRLLRLPEGVKDMLKQRLITEGHARSLLSLPNDEVMLSMAQQVAAEAWSVRELENRIKLFLGKASSLKDRGASTVDSGSRLEATSSESKKAPELMLIEDELRKVFGTKVSIRGHAQQGAIEIYFSGRESLHRIIHQIRGFK